MEEIKRRQDELLQLILKFDNACNDIGAKYSLACGTALGGIREKGFIAWDDDFDIMMTIDDYNLINSEYQRFRNEFAWVCEESFKDSPVVLARIYESNVDFNSLENFPYIDIHVFVGCCDDDKKVKKELSVSDFATKLYWIKKRKYHNIFSRKKSFIGSLCKIPLYLIPTGIIKKIIINSTKKWSFEASNRVMPVQGYYKMKEVLPKNFLADYINVDFNGYQLPIIKEYHLYLQQLYGDYMTPVRFQQK